MILLCIDMHYLNNKMFDWTMTKIIIENAYHSVRGYFWSESLHKKLLLSRRLPFCDKARRLVDHEITKKLKQSLYFILTPHLGVHSHTR